MKLHSHQLLQDEVFWSSALLFFAAAVTFGWLGVLLQTTTWPSLGKPLESTPTLVAPPSSITTAQTPVFPIPQQQIQPQIYWLDVVDNQLQLRPQRIMLDPNLTVQEQLQISLQLLLERSAKPHDWSSAIPAGTKLLAMSQQGNQVYVDLSLEFGQGGGSGSMIYRVAQVLYSVTSLLPEAQLYLSIEGQILDESHPLGGEGLLLPAPMTRQQFDRSIPPD